LSGSYTYKWADAAQSTVVLSTSGTPNFNPVSTTTYIVTITSSIGCTNTNTIKVSVNALPVVSVGSSHDTTCTSSPVTLTASGTGTSYQWSLTSDRTTILSSSSVLTASPATTTQYTVTATVNGCST